MDGQLLSFTSHLEQLVCWHEQCGMAFAMPQKFAQVARREGTTFHCPRGHRLRFGESEVEQLKKQLERERDRTQRERKEKEWAQQKTKVVERSRNAYKGKVTALKNRVGHGVCPCCNRNFQNLRRHMLAKHPNYATEEA